MNERRFNPYSRLYVPTLIDEEQCRHIIPHKDAPAYCGATGTQDAPRDWPRRNLCPRCVQKYIRGIEEGRP